MTKAKQAKRLARSKSKRKQANIIANNLRKDKTTKNRITIGKMNKLGSGVAQGNTQSYALKAKYEQREEYEQKQVAKVGYLSKLSNLIRGVK